MKEERVSIDPLEKPVRWMSQGMLVHVGEGGRGRVGVEGGEGGCHPPVNSGGQTISLIEFNPSSPQEAGGLAASVGTGRFGSGGGGGGGEASISP